MKRIGSRPFCIIMAVIIALILVVVSLPTQKTEFKRIYSTLDIKYEARKGNFVHYLDVGQADCTVITSDDEACLIDCGDEASGDKIVDKLDELGFNSVNFILITHAHDDHIGGLKAVLDQVQVGAVLISDWTPEDKDEAKLLASIEDMCVVSNINIITLREDDCFIVGDFTLDVLKVDPTTEDENDRSTVVRADCGENSFLFTGDATKNVEAALCHSSADIDCDVLKAGHHGSKESSSSEFLSAVSPGLAIFSCGAGNSYGHPSAETVARLNKLDIDYFRTDINGDIMIDADKLVVTAQYGKPFTSAA